MKRGSLVAGSVLVAMLFGLSPNSGLLAQQPGVHYLHSATSPPGAIGQWQLERAEPLRGYFQPVEIRAPRGALVSLVLGEDFDAPQPAPRRVRLLVGNVYRLKITGIPAQPGLELFPTIEIINRLYPPPGVEDEFPVPVEFLQEELVRAADGDFFTRVVYLEDPDAAVPVADDPERQRWMDVGPSEDPLQAADELGRPMAIVRLGGRLPENGLADSAFYFASPPFDDVARQNQDALHNNIRPVSMGTSGPAAGGLLPFLMRSTRAR